METEVSDRISPGLLRLLKFGCVGTLGLMWDTATLYSLRPFLGLTAATLVAYFVAASLNWAANRFWTFRDVGRLEHPILQWLRFLSANSLGFALNRGTIFLLFWLAPVCVSYPFIALAAGAVVGLLANFRLSSRLVFREKPPETAHELLEIVTGAENPELQNPIQSSETASELH
ncbi:MAG: GtrA family protein [Acetobacter sp.]|nr:GtrA family protein [Acetobacter sp.]